MIAILLAALFIGAECQILLVNNDAEAAKPDAGKKEIATGHIPASLKGGLNLQNGDLKLFAGHILNVLKHKCPKVDSKKVFQVQKYIGKLISNTDPIVSGESTQFAKLIGSLHTCVAGKAPPQDEQVQPTRSRPTFIFPLKNLADFFRKTIKKEDTEKIAEKEEAVPKEDAAEDSDEVDNGKWAVTSPEPTEGLIARIVVPGSQITSQGFASWISNIWNSMSDFFGRVFARRSRRSSEGDVNGASVVRLWSRYSPVQATPGKQAFTDLIDELCRIYCSSCNLPPHDALELMTNFKLAARELLKFVLEDESGVELVSNHVLDSDFLTSVKTCSPHH